MDKYEYKVRADEIKDLISRGEYVQAAEIADTIDWRRVKSVMMLCTISDLYKINRRYEDARDMLLLAYERRPGGRTICYSLCELSIKMEEFVEAVEYYKEFVQVAPKDSGRYILQYKLYEAQDVSLEERIAVLEELKKRDYREKWAYELAYLYHRIGLAARCVEECDELILWFGEGKYVVKAMELKMLHEALTPAQQEKYNNRFSMPAEEYVEEVQENQEAQTGYESQANDGSWPEYAEQSEGTVTEPAPDAIPVNMGADTIGYEPVQEAAPEEMEIHVNVGEYNTINLQEELAAGLQEVLAQEHRSAITDPITRSIVAPMLESDTESLDYPEIDEVSEDDLDSGVEEMEASEVFFGETGEIGDLQVPTVETAADMPAEEWHTEEMKEIVPEVVTESVPETVPDVTAEIVMQQLRQEIKKEDREEDKGASEEEHRETLLRAEPPKALASVLSQESDGQISLVMPERESIEKQITGQMSIDDILAEWERIKKENQEKRQEETRQYVLQQTGAMFTEFDAAVRDGLLEQLEREKTDANVPVVSAEAGEIPAVEDAIAETDEVEELEEIAEEDATEEESAEEASEDAVMAEYAVGEEVLEEAEELEAEEFDAEEFEAEEFEVEELEAEELEAEESATGEFETVEMEAVEAEAAFTEDFAETEIADEDSTEEASEEAVFGEEASGEEMFSEEASGGDFSGEAVFEDAVYEDVPDETASEEPRIRSLTREEKEMFAPYIQSRSAKEQLVNAIDNISLAAYTGNLIITGDEGMDILTLAKNMIRELQMIDRNFSGKVAKISGAALNKKNVAETIDALKNGALIVIRASEIGVDTAQALHKALQQEMVGVVIVLVDTRKAMDRFLADNEILGGSFTARMDVEALSNDVLVAFGKRYAREREYSIDDFGVLALHTRIEELQTIDHAVTVVEVQEIVDEAIRHANRKTLGHFFDILFARRYDDEDMIILGEKDFV